jgi:hypothetical protein
VADRLRDAGASAFNFAMDAWDLKPGLPEGADPHFSSSCAFVELAPLRSIETEIKPIAIAAVEKVKTAIATNHRVGMSPPISDVRRRLLSSSQHFQGFSDGPAFALPASGWWWQISLTRVNTAPDSGLPFARSETTSGGKGVKVQRVRIQNTARIRPEQVRGSEPGYPDEDPRDPLL